MTRIDPRILKIGKMQRAIQRYKALLQHQEDERVLKALNGLIKDLEDNIAKPGKPPKTCE